MEGAGTIVLAVATTVFVNVSYNRHDTTRVARQIENGRYAMSLLSDDLVNAGYFGEFDPRAIPISPADPDIAEILNPCSERVDLFWKAVMLHVQGYGPGMAKPACITDVKPLS